MRGLIGMNKEEDKLTERMDLYMAALVAARVAGWRGKGSEDSVGGEGIEWSFGLCIEAASDEDQLAEIAFVASKAIEAVDASVAFDHKCDTTCRIDKIRERRGLPTIWADGLTL